MQQFQQGSPPRMRGKVAALMPENRVVGITPAYAGKRVPALCRPLCRRDHPRVCGEKRYNGIHDFCSKGSPPRVRGKGHCRRKKEIRLGITPACAGKRMVFAGRKSRTWDHPRVCGEKVSSTSPIKCLKGSPPRMRGKVKPVLRAARVAGITPAYAGKRHCPRSRPGRTQDHPRVCGEKLA